MTATTMEYGRLKVRRTTKDLTDGEGSLSSNEKEFEGDYAEAPLKKRVKKEKLDNDYIHENGLELNEMYDSSPGESEVGSSQDPEYLPNGKVTNGKSAMDGNKLLLNPGRVDAIQSDNPPLAGKKYVQFWNRSSNRPRRSSGGGRRLSYSPDTDRRLLQWVMDRDKNGLTVSREAIQTQALALIREECPDFKASSGWVEKFLIRHKLCLPTKANMLENGVAKKGMAVTNGTDGVPYPPVGIVPGVEKNGEEEKVENGIKQEPIENDKKAVNLMDIPINRRGPARKRVVRDFKDDEDDEEDCDPDPDPDDPDCDLEKTVPENVNPERLKAFNMFVRLFVDENLDRLVPISKQPKDKVLAIIHACQRQFPEFRERARKRIRTYLKSCRRLKKLKEPLKRTADQINTAPSMSSAQMQEVNNILASACANEADLGEGQSSALATQTSVQSHPSRPPLTNGLTSSPAETGGRTSTSTMTSFDTHPPSRNGSPAQRLSSFGTAVGPESIAAARAKVSAEYKLNVTEVTAIRQLITSYRESASFLYRSADELEALLPTSTQSTQKATR